jgi:hypothetical protein
LVKRSTLPGVFTASRTLSTPSVRAIGARPSDTSKICSPPPSGATPEKKIPFAPYASEVLRMVPVSIVVSRADAMSRTTMRAWAAMS